MDSSEIIFSAVCAAALICFVYAFGWIQIAVWTPLFSHLYHILFGEGSLSAGDPWYDSYEIVVVGEVLILRLLTFYYIPTSRAFSLGAIALLVLVWVDTDVYDRIALGLDIVAVGFQV
jgi:hypothetical protein